MTNENQYPTSDLLHELWFTMDEDYNTICDAKNAFKERYDSSTIRKTAEYKPNMKWNYSSGTTNLLSGILRSSSTHQEYLDFGTRLISIK
jgi:hypothetical protein